MPRYREPRRWDVPAECRDWPLGSGRRRFRRALNRMSTVVLGVKRAPTPVVSRTCGTWKPRQGPAMVVAGKPTVRNAEFPGGDGMTREANAGLRKATGNRDRWLAPPPVVSDNWPDRADARPERVLTRVR